MSDPIFPKAVWQEGTLQNDVPANDNSLRDEALGRPVEAIANSPSVTDDGTVYIVGAAPSGDFSAFDPDDLTIYRGGTWYAWAPTEGLEANGYRYTGSGGWVVDSGGGGGSPGGSDTQVQFNDGGSFGGDSGLVWNKTTDTLTLVNGTFTGLALTAASATGGSGFRLPHGAAPASPTNGDVWTTTAGMYVRINGATIGPLAAAGGGSLTNWTEAYGAGTQSTSSFTATNAATNVNAALVAKGNGATVAQEPTGTTAGGNSRGQLSTDWQKSRGSAGQVTQGNYSSIGGGQNNQTGGAHGAIPGGFGNNVNDAYGSIGGGNSNTAGNAAHVGGGVSNSASASYSTVAGGESNATTGSRSWCPGGSQFSDRGIVRSGGWSAGQFSVAGDAQVQEFVLRSDTTNATPEAMTTDNSTASSTNTIALPNNSAYDVSGRIVARDTAGNAQTWTVDAMIIRGANAAATTFVGGGTPTVKFTQGTFSGAIALTANTTIGGLAVTVTGVAATNIKWVASLRATQVVG